MKDVFFHTFDKNGEIEWQGVILRCSKDMVLTVQLFCWFTGCPNRQETLELSEATSWRFYDSEVAWRNAGDKACAPMVARARSSHHGPSRALGGDV